MHGLGQGGGFEQLARLIEVQEHVEFGEFEPVGVALSLPIEKCTHAVALIGGHLAIGEAEQLVVVHLGEIGQFRSQRK